MKIVCALCEREGKTNDLGEREPYDNPATTHGICPRHQEQVVEALPSQSFPDAELLIVVRPNDTDLYEYLLRRFDGVSGVRVILERRRADHPVGEHVRDERRIRRGTVSTLGYTLVRFKRKSAPAATASREAIMGRDALRLLIQQKIRDGRLPRGALPAAIAGRPGDGSRCQVCDRIITSSELHMLLPLPEKPPSQVGKTLSMHGDCFQMWSQANG